MENFFFGIQGSSTTIKPILLAVINHPLLWGFGLGFLASTMIHLFIITDIPHAIPLMVRKGPIESFQRIAPKNAKGDYLISYTDFQKEHLRVRIAFYLTILAFLLVVILALLRS
ncbi:hypothetical protein HYV71_04680 [Candidatus Uhrbacteria bacterium]|nr:hypothetical protein [Candidatus Uhrbacteria bacterium]